MASIDYRDPTILLNILKPKKGNPPPFGAIEYDQTIFDGLLMSSSSSSSSASSSGRPSLIVLCGPPGCGKSTIKMQLLAEGGVTDYINIDPDEIRTILMANGVRFDFTTEKGKETMAGITNAFNKRMSDRAQEMGLNIVFDTTGQNFRAVSGLIKSSKDIGYKTTFAVIWASKETCLRRVKSRNEYLLASGSGRIQMPPEIVTSIYDKFLNGTASMLLIQYPVTADNVLLYNNDTDGAEPVLLFSKEGTRVTSSDFSGFYNMTLTSAEPFITVTKKGGKRRKTYCRTYKKNKRTKTKRRRNKKSKRHFK
jgi:predicted kinase